MATTLIVLAVQIVTAFAAFVAKDNATIDSLVSAGYGSLTATRCQQLGLTVKNTACANYDSVYNILTNNGTTDEKAFSATLFVIGTCGATGAAPPWPLRPYSEGPSNPANGETYRLFRNTSDSHLYGWAGNEWNRLDDAPLARGLASSTCVVVHSNLSSTAYQAATDTNVARGTALLAAVASLVGGDSLYLSPGRFDCGSTRVLIPDGAIKIYGDGIDSTTIVSSPNDDFSSVLKLGTGTQVFDLTVDTSADPAHATPVGFDAGHGQTIATSSRVERVKVVGYADGFRFITGGAVPFTINIVDCVARCNWDIIASGGNGSATSFVTVWNPDFVSDGSANQNTVGVAGGGTFNIYGGTIKASGSSVANVAVTAATVTNVVGTKITTSGVGAFDVLQSGGSVANVTGGNGSLTDGSGQGPGGSFRVSGTVSYPTTAVQSTSAPIGESELLHPVILAAKKVTLLTTGTPADIATIRIPSWITRYRILGTTISSSASSMAFAETAAGTLAGASVTAYTAAAAGGSQMTTATTMAAAANTGVSMGQAGADQVFTNQQTIYFRQTSNSANAGTVTFYIAIWPMP